MSFDHEVAGNYYEDPASPPLVTQLLSTFFGVEFAMRLKVLEGRRPVAHSSSRTTRL
jgi:hypothetical protein